MNRFDIASPLRLQNLVHRHKGYGLGRIFLKKQKIKEQLKVRSVTPDDLSKQTNRSINRLFVCPSAQFWKVAIFKIHFRTTKN